MSHPLEDVIRGASGFLLIGDSSKDRFPGFSFNVYTRRGVHFYCLDLGGLKESRGPSPGHKVYTSVDELPEDRGDLAILWVHPKDAKRAVDMANEAGCARVWFSFQTGHPDAVAHARELGMEIVEIGRCPVYYTEDLPPICAAHKMMEKASGAYSKPPQLDATVKRRELW